MGATGLEPAAFDGVRWLSVSTYPLRG